MKGIVVYGFAWRKNGDSPCNIVLAHAAKCIADAEGGQVLILAQRTTASILKSLGVDCYVVGKGTGYEGSEQVTRQAVNLFSADESITEVIPVAQPVMQLVKCIALLRKEGFKTPSFLRLVKMIGWVGFDSQSVQPATRGPLRLAFYTLRQILFGYRPPVEQSEP